MVFVRRNAYGSRSCMVLARPSPCATRILYVWVLLHSSAVLSNGVLRRKDHADQVNVLAILILTTLRGPRHCGYGTGRGLGPQWLRISDKVQGSMRCLMDPQSV